MKKRILTVLMTLGITFCLPSVTAEAAGFVQTPEGVKYQQDDGSYLADSWVQVGNAIYRMGADGVVLVNQWVQVNGLWYQLDVNGICVNPAGSTTAPAGIATVTPTAPSTTGQRNALRQAKSYLEIMPFSYQGLVEQLIYEGYTADEAAYGAANCGADWNAQALKAAQKYLNIMGFSYQGLLDQLIYEGYTADQAAYGVANCGANWYDQAAKTASRYLSFMSFSRASLIDQLIYEGFTPQTVIEQVGNKNIPALPAPGWIAQS